ncbi:TPA: hypothetical protein ACX6QE_000471 [Photobacterium damselae]
MALDTRGILDGALRGFDMMERHYERQDRKAERALRLRHLQADRDEERRRYQQSQQDQAARFDEEKKRWQWQFDEQRAHHRHRRSLAQRHAQQAERQFSLQYQQQQRDERRHHLNENRPLLQQAWAQFLSTGELDPMFDHPHVKGGAYDVRRYNRPLIQTFERVQRTLPKVLSGEAPMAHLLDDFDRIYRTNLDEAVGKKDASGKVIARTRLASIDLAEDIDPHRQGEQGGLVLGMEVFYQDGSSGGVRPITQSRSTADEDNVLVIPVEAAVQDITGQLQLAQQAAASPFYQQLFRSHNDKEYRQERNKIESEFVQVHGDLLKDGAGFMDEETIAQLNAQYTERINRLNQLYQRPPELSQSDSVMAQWLAHGDRTEKQAFIERMEAEGLDLTEASLESLQRNYERYVAQLKEQEQATKDALMLRAYQEQSGSSNGH